MHIVKQKLDWKWHAIILIVWVENPQAVRYSIPLEKLKQKISTLFVIRVTASNFNIQHTCRYNQGKTQFYSISIIIITIIANKLIIQQNYASCHYSNQLYTCSYHYAHYKSRHLLQLLNRKCYMLFKSSNLEWLAIIKWNSWIIFTFTLLHEYFDFL